MVLSDGNGSVTDVGGVFGRQVRPVRFMEQVRDRMRVKSHNLRAERVYVGWIRRSILTNGWRSHRAAVRSPPEP